VYFQKIDLYVENQLNSRNLFLTDS